MQKTIMPTTKDFSPVNLSIWIKKPQHRWMITLGGDYKNKSEQVSIFLSRYGINIDDVEINWLYNFLTKMKNKYVKEYFIYSNLPHDFRDISNYQDLLGFLAHNSMKNKYIQGITMPLGNQVSQPLSVVFKDILNDNLVRDLTFINYCFSITQNFTLFTEVAKLKLNGGILDCPNATNVYTILEEMFKKWELDFEFSELICPHITSLLKFMNHELYSAPWLNDTYYYSFIKSQKLIGNVWLGKGILYINLPKLRIEITILNIRISQIMVNTNKYTFTQLEVGYINSVLINANLGRLEDYFTRIDHSKWPETSIGLSQSGLISIDQNRNLRASFENFTYSRSIRNKATDPSDSVVYLQRNFSYKIVKQSEGLDDLICTINVLKVDPKNMLEILMSLYDNDFNRKQIESRGEIFKQYMKVFIGEVTDLDLRVDVNVLFELFQSSKIYSMMSDLVLNDKLSKNMLKPRKHIYPGQEGGLLSAMMDYKSIKDSFQFEYDNIITPELMSLKSSQPQAFMSNLITKFKEKYNTLYAGIDKETIKRDLIKLADLFDTGSYQGKVLSLLTTWGYIGVMGALDEMEFIKKADNFTGVRLYKTGDPFLKYNQKSFSNFLGAFLKSAQQHNYFNQITDIDYLLYCKSFQDLQKLVISYVHSVTINCYDSVSDNIVYYSNLELIKLSNTLKILLSDEKFCESLSNNLSEDPMLFLIPIEPKFHKDLMIMIETLANSYYKIHKSDHKLDFHKVVEHDHELIQPYVKTKEILEQTKCRFKASVARHHGVIPHEFFTNVVNHKFVRYSSKVYDFNFSVLEESDLSLPFNKFYLIKNRLEGDPEEISDSDEYYDLIMELESDCPDEDTINDSISELLAPDYTRKFRLRYKGDMMFVPHFDIKYAILPNLRSNPNKLNYIRNSGTTLLIVTNTYLVDLVECQEDNVKLFRPLDNIWENRTLLDPDCIIYYVIDSIAIDVQLWCLALKAESIDKVQLAKEKTGSVTNLYMNEKGQISCIDKYSSLEDKLQLLKTDEASSSNIEEPDIEQDFSQFENKELRKLKEQGFDDEFILSVRNHLKIYSNQDWGTLIRNMAINAVSNKRLMESIKKKTKQATENVLNELKDVNQATKIFEVASVFGSVDKTKSKIRNKALKDNGFRAEVDSFYPGLCDKILSGTLSVSSKCKRIFNKHCKAMRRFAMADKKDREKKLFFIDFACLIVNDAFDEEEQNDDNIFENIQNIITDKIVNDDDEEDYDFAETYKKLKDMGKIYYDW